MKARSSAEYLRQAVQKDGRPRCEIARLAHISQSQLSRLMKGDRGVNLATADKLAPVLGLVVFARLVDQPKDKP